MDKHISVGDLVQIVKPTVCCGNADSIGTLFIVKQISGGKGTCGLCNHISYVTDAFCTEADSWFDLSRLKRIPPLSELETVDIQETTNA